ncbi:hypothetical protein MYBA111488_24865 [Mycobacterium basiliense]
MLEGDLITNHLKKDVEDPCFSKSLDRNGCKQALHLVVLIIASLAVLVADVAKVLAEVVGYRGWGGVVED